MSQPFSMGAFPKTPPVSSSSGSDAIASLGHNTSTTRDHVVGSTPADIAEKRKRPKRRWNAPKKRENKKLPVTERQLEDDNMGILAEALLSMKSISKQLNAQQNPVTIHSQTFHASSGNPPDDIRQKAAPSAGANISKIYTPKHPNDVQGQQIPSPFSNVVTTKLTPIQKFFCDQNLIMLLKKKSAKHPKAEFVCTLCSYYCDTLSVVEKHISDRRHRESMKERSIETTIDNMPMPAPSQIAFLTRIIEDNFKTYGLTARDCFLRQNIAKSVNALVSQAMPECLVRLYGSSITAMGLKNSDVNLDLVVSTDQVPSKVLLAVNDLIESDTSFTVIECNLNADLPAVVFLDNASGLNCVMCLNNHNAYETSCLLAHYESIDERVRPLAVMLRSWASLCQIDQVDLGAWPPYAFSLLLVYYLQQLENPVLPVLHELDETPNPENKPEIYLHPSKIGDSWQCKNNASLGELWLNLLRFYVRDFSMGLRVVCIQQLAPLKRSVKKWTGRKLAIEDPFLSKRNVSRTIVNMVTFDFILRCFQTTYIYYAIPQTEDGAIFGSIQKPADPEEYGPEYETMLKHNTEELQSIIAHDPRYSTKPFAGKCRNYGELVVTKEIATLMFQKFNPCHLTYGWNRDVFCGYQDIPVVCCMCRREGHRTDECPEEELPPVEPLPPMNATFERYLSELCFQTFNMLSPNEEEIMERQMIVQDIQEYLLTSIPTAQLELFGSSCNGFGLHKSDMDICLTFVNNKTGKSLNFAQIIEDILVKLRKYKMLNNLIAITTAKVPILKFVHCPTKLEGDISVYNTLGQRNTKMLRAYADIDPRVPMLGFMIKKFAKLCDICDASRGSLSSYAYILMVIYFLQQCDPPVVPVLQQLRKRNREPTPVIVEGCNTYFFEDVANLGKVWSGLGKNTTSIGLLWLQLLRFYTEDFDYKINVIAIKQKEVLPRFEKLWNTKSMAIEDPFDLTHNLGVGLSRKMHMFILKAFLKARTHFGTPVELAGTPLLGYFFNKIHIVDGVPPNDRGCRICKKIGHQVKDCQQKRSGGKNDGRGARGEQREREHRGEQFDMQRRNQLQRGGPNIVPYANYSNGLLPDPRRFNNIPNGHQQAMALGYQSRYQQSPMGTYLRDRFDGHAQSRFAPSSQDLSRLEIMRQTSLFASKFLNSRSNW